MIETKLDLIIYLLNKSTTHSVSKRLSKQLGIEYDYFLWKPKRIITLMNSIPNHLIANDNNIKKNDLIMANIFWAAIIKIYKKGNLHKVYSPMDCRRIIRKINSFLV